MTDDVNLSCSRTFPADVERSFDQLLSVDLSRLFSRRYAAIPSFKSVREQAGEWSTAVQTRTSALADGGTMREELREVTRPERFAYRINEITGPMKRLVASVDGAWELEPVGIGARITWAWTVHPAGRLGSLAMPLFRRMWQGYARQGFDTIEGLLVR